MCSLNQVNQWVVRLAAVLKQRTKQKLVTCQFQKLMRLLNYHQMISVWFQIRFSQKLFADRLFHAIVNSMWQAVVLSLVGWNQPSLFLTTIKEFDNEAPSMLARDSSYSQGSTTFTIQNLCCLFTRLWNMREEWSYFSLTPSSLTPSNLLIGEKLLIYVHPARYNVFDYFW